MKKYSLILILLINLVHFEAKSQNLKIHNIEEFALELFNSKNYEKVLSEIEPLVLNNPSSITINQIVGYSKIELRYFKEGVDWLNYKKSNITAMDNLYLGKGYQGLGNDSLALVHLKIAAPLDLNNNIYNIIHDIHYKQKRYADAAQAGLNVIQWKEKKSLKASSGDYFKVAMDYYFVAAFMNITDIFGRQAMAIRADSMFSKAIELNHKWPPFYISRARANNLIDNTQTKWLGAPYYEKFLVAVELQIAEKGQYKVDKNHLFEAYKYLGGYYLANAINEAKVKDYFTKALEIRPDDPDIKSYFIHNK